MFTILYRSNDVEEARLGLAISKKNCKLATARNRLKRLIRESFRTHRGELAGLDIVVINQAAAASAANKVLTDCLEKHWKRCRETVANKAGKN
jgi:ribonuclease P protein component